MILAKKKNFEKKKLCLFGKIFETRLQNAVFFTKKDFIFI